MEMNEKKGLQGTYTKRALASGAGRVTKNEVAIYNKHAHSEFHECVVT